MTSRLPLRLRLVAGFAAAMLVVLTAAAGFVYWRVRYDLDLRLDADLAAQVTDLQRAARSTADPAAALSVLGGQGSDAQLLDAGGRVVAAGADAPAEPLVPAGRLADAQARPLAFERGNLLSRRSHHLRVRTRPVGAPGRPAAVAVAVVRLDQRDEALRELLGQLALANLAALVVASLVGDRLARAALLPVERYRARAEQVAGGATGLRLDVPDGPDDEVSRLGHTLNAMLTAQERSAAQQRQFVDDASHELRTPVTLLSGEVELALSRPRSAAELAAALRRVAETTRRLGELTDDLLTLGAQGSRAPELRDVAVGPLLEAAAVRARGQLPTDTDRRVRADSPAGLLARAEPALLARAVGNLADNAVRHGGGDVTLAATAVPAGVLLAVSDQGPGMPADFLPAAAERFRQGRSSRATAGSGLGLALVDAVAAAHGGQLRVCSAGSHHRRPAADRSLDEQPCRHPASGTTLTLLLPGGGP